MIKYLKKPILWAILYITLIPTFGFIYYFQKNNFFHSTIKYEKSYINYIKDIEYLISQNIAKSVSTDSSITTFININEHWALNKDNINININDINDDGSVSCSVILELLQQKKNLANIAFINLTIYTKDTQVFYNNNLPLYLPEININDKFLPYNGENDPDNIVEKILYNSTIDHLKNTQYLKFSENEFKQIQILISSNLGLPSELHNSLLRMMYLSAITITTLGYGDIVPISDIARIFIAIESVLGIIIAGIFVSTLLQYIYDAMDEPTPINCTT